MWHEARLICREVGIGDMEIYVFGQGDNVGGELLLVYNLILRKPEKSRKEVGA